MNNPLRFRPYLRPMVWGGQSLRDVLGKPLPTPEPYGEAWEISDHGSHQSVIVAGDEAGRSLRELMLRAPDAMLGSPSTSSISPVQKTRGAFPWLVKFLDACDWLSVQVHPTMRRSLACGRARAARPRHGSSWRRSPTVGCTPAFYRALMRSICAPPWPTARSRSACISLRRDRGTACSSRPGRSTRWAAACSSPRCSRPVTPPFASLTGTGLMPRDGRVSFTLRKRWRALIGSAAR